MTLPNFLSCSRYFLAFPMAYLVWEAQWVASAFILWIAIATDISDGYIARIRNQTSALGGLLDHSSDAFFVTFMLLALVHHDLVPVALPCFVLAAFLQYTLDSRALSGQPLRTSNLGRYNGISYFVMGGFPVTQNALQIQLIPEAYFPWIAWGLVITTAISMLDRLVTLLTSVNKARADKSSTTPLNK